LAWRHFTPQTLWFLQKLVERNKPLTNPLTTAIIVVFPLLTAQTVLGCTIINNISQHHHATTVLL
jgi:hypothetical protein